MKRLFTALYPVLQAIAMPACICFQMSSCDKVSVSDLSPTPMPDSIPVLNSIPMVYPYQKTGLPVCYINTKDSLGIVSKTDYVEATLSIEQDGRIIFEDQHLSIRGRGQATWSDFPKKPYKLKLSEKNRLFDMAANKHFVLMANYCDKSLMRTAIGFKIGHLLDVAWTPQYQYVEVVLNGDHIGNYLLVESVRKGKHRINIDNSGFIIQYIYESRLKHEPYFFVTDRYKAGYGFKYPDEEDMTEERINYATEILNEFERSLFEPVRPREYADYIDLESFAKWYYQLNLMMMVECNLYFIKPDSLRDSRLYMGPLWDFDWSLGVGLYEDEQRSNPNHQIISQYYFKRLAEDSLFMEEVAKVHKQYGPVVRTEVLRYFDELRDYLQKSQKLNYQRWDTLNERVSIGAFPLGSWEAEVACDRQFFIDHYDYIDKYIKNML